MSKGKAIFQAVCGAPDLELALKELPAKDYIRLYSYLLQSYEENGVSGQVLGLLLVEGTRRYVGEALKKVREVLG